MQQQVHNNLVNNGGALWRLCETKVLESEFCVNVFSSTGFKWVLPKEFVTGTELNFYCNNSHTKTILAS